MKKGVVFLLFLFFMPIVFAEYSEEIFDDWVYHEHDFTVDEKDFYTTVSPSSTTMSIAYGDDRSVIRLSDCVTLASKFKVCFRERELWYKDKLEREEFKARIELSKLLAKINISRQISNLNPLIQEQFTIRTILANTGSFDATDITFIDNFPAEFKIINTDACIITGTGIKWAGNLTIGTKTSCTYTIQALALKNHSSVGQITYYDGDKQVKENSTIQEIKIPSYVLSLVFNSTKNVEIGEVIEVNMTLRNKDLGNDLFVADLSLDFPAGFEILQHVSDFRQSGNSLVFSGGVSKGKERSAWFRIKPTLTGHYPFIGTASFQIDNIIKKIPVYSEEELAVFARNLSIKRYMPSVALSGSTFILNSTIKNPTKHIFKNLKATLISDIPGVNQSSDLVIRIEPTQEQDIDFGVIQLPVVDENKIYYVDLVISYLTPYSEYIELTEHRFLEVKTEAFVKSEIISPKENSSNPVIQEASPDISEIIHKSPKPVNKTVIILIILFLIIDVFIVIKLLKYFKK